MSIQAMAWVLEFSESVGTDRLVLLAIANHADIDAASAWPSVTRIAAEARVDRATVFRALRRLEELGELEVTRGGGRGVTNLYRIKRSQPATVSPPETVAPCDGLEAVNGRNSSLNGRTGAENGRTRATRTFYNHQEPLRGHARAREADDDATGVKLPEPLEEETRKKGAEFVRGLRRHEATG